jgi:polyhydroxybutyrate depolymerase
LESGDYNLSIDAGPMKRRYFLHVPKLEDQNLPLVMMLHGAGGTAAWTADHYGWRELADARRFFVAFPQGLPLHPTLPPDFRQNPSIWDDGSGWMHQPDRPNDVTYLSAVLDDIASRCRVDRNRIYATGFSNGASMTFRMGIELADRLAAIAPMSGHCRHKTVVLKRPVPTLYIVGTADPFNPINGGLGANPWGAPTPRPAYAESVSAWRKMIGAGDSPASTQSADGITTTTYLGVGGCPLIYMTIDGQGHEWPGHKRALPRAVTGHNVRTPDATALIWDFFKGQSLSASPPPSIPRDR